MDGADFEPKFVFGMEIVWYAHSFYEAEEVSVENSHVDSVAEIECKE